MLDCLAEEFAYLEDRLRRSGEAWFCIPQRDIDTFSPSVLKVRDRQQGTMLGAAAVQMADVLRDQNGGGGDDDVVEYLDTQMRL
ncbi:hypothetical protein MN608_03128 [Microdochium nivale]|nr:hypothetical protein MN608_03128 [Microdochium nivale]